MRIARKLVLLAFTAIAVMALAAGTASAQEIPDGLDLRNEAVAGQPVCDPCEVRVEGEAHLVALPSGVRISQCRNNFHVRVYGRIGGNPVRGEIEWDGVNDNPQPECVLVNCISSEDHWSATSFGSLSGTTGHFTVRFCLRSTSGTELHCNAEIAVAVNPAAHSYMFSTVIICAGGARRIEGEGNADSTGIEVVSL